MPGNRFLLASCLLLPTLVWSQTLLATPEIPLWPGKAPGAKGTGPKHNPIMYHYPATKPNGCGVIVLPGGGYNIHAIDHEGTQVARRLNRMGITAFVLKYRLKPDGYTEKDAFVDGKRAVRLVRTRAKEFGLDPQRIGVLGFSAGGHLASSLGVNPDPGDADAADPIDRASSRPDFMVICYTIPAPQDQRVNREHGRRKPTKQTPPAFLWVTHADAQRPAATAAFYQQLHAAGVDAELHSFGGWGPHGLGLAPGESGVGVWVDLLETWLRRKNLFTDQPRIALRGTIQIAGKPLNRGWLTLTPTENSFAPIAATYVTEKKGTCAYTFTANNGPIPGTYRVTIWELSKGLLTEPTMPDAQSFELGKIELNHDAFEMDFQIPKPDASGSRE